MQNKLFLIKLTPIITDRGCILPKRLSIIFVSIFICIISAILCFYKHNTPKRYAIFAGFNPNGTIPSYVITYLKGLNEVTNGIVYIADSSLKDGELNKLKDINILYTSHIRHQEYDWGSYKRGFNWLKENNYLPNTDELIFANDSCYAPITSFKPMFKTMQSKPDLDFWGDLQNTQFSNHIQSYFIVFRKKIINSKSFNNFINQVTHHDDTREYITKYETKLTPFLENIVYKCDTYMPYKQLSHLKASDKNSYPLTLIKEYNHQFLKRRTFTSLLMISENIHTLVDYLYTNHPQTFYNLINEVDKKHIPPHLLDKKNETKSN